MNVSDGGKQPKHRSTVFNGMQQSMVNASAEPKGLRTVLEERSVSTTGMLKADMVNILDKMHDFQYKKTRVEEFVCDHGHSCLFVTIVSL